MLFLDHSSPRPGYMPEAWLMENSPLFSPTAQAPCSPHSAHQSPLIKRAKRRLSDDTQSTKKSCSNERRQETPEHDWPVFEHPHGGVIQQSPYGNIRVVRVGNTEHSTIVQKPSLDCFVNTENDPLAKHTRELAQKSSGSLASQSERPLTPNVFNSVPMKISPSPSAEVESYMLEGYREINKSYTMHQEEIVNVNYSLYDQSHEDAHLDGSNDDYEMTL
ncbi:CYFA0S04e00694g1_1 [Cyberlindnera fabianii]|uniref:CYFA0S04e00694g1_1 n=1 Tax=Cyberlindnera fabianii TaxID=36022 RepID=A0A061AX31_CYBFA|nr:CYFA0S04e00694g1_1 [Cyberlindnera fabianii]